MKAGGLGQFEIHVGGRMVIERKGGLIAKLVGRRWPEDAEVLVAVRQALSS